MNPLRVVRHDDPKRAFESAINQGLLSRSPEVDNYAGNYMYMHTEANGSMAFKNILFRNYIYSELTLECEPLK